MLVGTRTGNLLTRWIPRNAATILVESSEEFPENGIENALQS